MNKDELEKLYYKNLKRIDNAEKWFSTHDPVDDDSKEYRTLLDLIKQTNKLYYELFVSKNKSE